MAAAGGGVSEAALAAVVGKSVAVVLADGTSFVSDLLVAGGEGGGGGGEGGPGGGGGAVAVFRKEPAHTYLKADYTIVPVAAIRSIEAVGAARPLPLLRTPSDDEVRGRLEDMRAAASRRIATRGVGVTAEAQAVFDGINKVYVGCWFGAGGAGRGPILVATNTQTQTHPHTHAAQDAVYLGWRSNCSDARRCDCPALHRRGRGAAQVGGCCALRRHVPPRRAHGAWRLVCGPDA